MNEKGAAFIRRKRKKEKFTRLSNEMLQNDGLSWKARGLLSYMLSMPDDWIFYETELVTHSKKDGITSLRSAMKELKEFGYVVKEPQRDELGKITNWVTYVDEEPINSPDYRKPTIWETHNVDNQTLLTTDSLQTNKNNNIKDIVSQDDTYPYQRIIDYLNRRVGSRFDWRGKEVQSLIRARFKEGAVAEDFKTVIDKKWKQWHNDVKMVKYLRPKTLFAKGKFNEYLGEAELLIENKPKRQYEKQTALGEMMKMFEGGSNDESYITTSRNDVRGNVGYLLQPDAE